MLPVFGGSNERLDHVGVDEVAVELVQLRQPEIETGVVGVLPAATLGSEGKMTIQPRRGCANSVSIARQ